VTGAVRAIDQIGLEKRGSDCPIEWRAVIRLLVLKLS
jgi:hypothetical protein